VLVGDADAHGKNYSLLHQRHGIVLAPLYDLMCPAAYPEIHAKLAMNVGKRARLEEFTPDTWDDFAGEVDVGAPYARRHVRRRARQLADQALAAIPTVEGVIADAGFGGEDLKGFAAVVTERANRLVAISQGVRQPHAPPIGRHP